ncbi:MAG: hypothetical protein IPQ24_00960 [Anaeromyxobacter sp.]|nr:hypothetical protein [Anaeromyxobacter sp.]
MSSASERSASTRSVTPGPRLDAAARTWASRAALVSVRSSATTTLRSPGCRARISASVPATSTSSTTPVTRGWPCSQAGSKPFTPAKEMGTPPSRSARPARATSSAALSLTMTPSRWRPASFSASRRSAAARSAGSPKRFRSSDSTMGCRSGQRRRSTSSAPSVC